MFRHADTSGIDITADIKLLGCALIPAREMIAHQKLGVCYCHRRAEESQAHARYYQQHYSGFGKTLAKLCSGIYIQLEVLYCCTHEVAISNQGSIIQLKKHIHPLLWVPECKVKTKPIKRHFNPLLICYIWIRIEWFVFNIQAALFVIVLEPM